MAKSKDGAPVSLIDSYLSNARTDLKSTIYTASEHGSRIVGIPIHPIALAWLIHCDVMPLQSIITLNAEPKSYKTSTVFDFMRMFSITPPFDGMGIYINTEGKLSPTKITSLIPQPYVDRIQVHSARGTDGPDGWQSYATYHLEHITKIMGDIAKRRKAGEKTFMPPVVMAIDSIGGTQTEEVADKISDNAQGRGYQNRAYLNTMFLNSWSARMIGLPVLLIFVNHLKDAMDGFGKTTPGGVAAGFHTSLEIRIRRVPGKEAKKFNGVPAEITKLEWHVYFSSIGRDGRKIELKYIDTYDEAGNQICWFDWHEALVTLLLKLQKTPEYPELEGLVGIEVHEAGNLGQLYTCKLAGITTKEQAKEMKMNASALGHLLQTTPEFHSLITSALRIQRFNHWFPDFEMPPIPVERAKPESKKKKK